METTLKNPICNFEMLFNFSYEQLGLRTNAKSNEFCKIKLKQATGPVLLQCIEGKFKCTSLATADLCCPW